MAGIGGLAALGGLAACSSGGGGAAASSAAATPAAGPNLLRAPVSPDSKLEVVLLGTQAGSPIVPDRSGISTALVVDGHVYLVDCGRGAATQYIKSGLPLNKLEAMFITHLHADHIADYFNFFLLGGFVPQPWGDDLVWALTPFRGHDVSSVMPLPGA
ncbi:MBL fold metallo-hydrolase [Gordonia sp. (in: high G+C Gram-positive bacteria)]|uniref:MBL fold metallo-hydrolase n=1 Tax=Gordonia sp. (in: high G+C Gram-positive bacteria) TaxID=84139 RepID=UPI003C77818A